VQVGKPTSFARRNVEQGSRNLLLQNSIRIVVVTCKGGDA
jgi:hypothetical protein